MPSRTRLLLPTFLGVVVLSSWAMRADEPAAGLRDIRDKVKQLVEELGDPDAAKHTAAETALLKLGPDILPLLPEDDAKLTPAQADRLKAVRAALREALVQKDLAPRTMTLQDASIPLSKALAELARQTGTPVEDGRPAKDDDPKLKLDLNKATFWQALDAIAREADLRISPYEGKGVIALREGPHQVMPVSYSGLFRVAARRIQATRDLGAEEGHTCTVFLEIAWEPRFQALFLDTKPDSLEATDEKGSALKVMEAGEGRSAVSGRRAVEVPVRLEAPPRSATKLGLLKGSFAVLGPNRMLTFTFDDLAKAGKDKPKKTQQGVAVTLREFSTEPDLWTFGLLLEYPPDGPDFESFESWLVNNQARLEKDGKSYPPAGDEIDSQTGHQALVKYRFAEEKGLVLGKPEGWKLVYQTPGSIIKVPVKFEFKDLPLP
jgi:hypothetical protein